MVEVVSLIQQNPRAGIIIVAVLISFFITLVNYFFTDRDRMRELRSRQKEMQKKVRAHQKAGEHEKMLALQKQMMTEMPEMFKHSMKPMLITFIPIIVLFGIIRNVFESTALASSWFWWYLVAALVSSILFRKLFRMP